MLLACPNDVKIYDLSSGKSLPEWISDRKRRKLLQKDVDLRRRIQLIQDFEMPDCSNHVCLSRDEQYVFVSGVYKPRVRCFDVNNLSLKFERCLDSEPRKLIPLSDGYEKFIVIEEDRWVELHVQYGHYHKIRLPKFCRDACYIDAVCELFVTGSGQEVYRLNLELGRFMTPLATEGSSLTACDVNTFHQLFVCGTAEGQVEAWDPRTDKRVGKFEIFPQRESLPVGADTGISCLKFKDHLHLAAGTGWGQVFVYDIRSTKPLLCKDHQYDLPIKAVEFCSDADLILSMDGKAVKVWRNDPTTSTVASIEPGLTLNGMCLVPRSGMVFLPNEGQKVYSYYIPTLGPAPRWCSFLDNITEELEETETPAVYDDYKFLTMEELEQLGLTNLIGTNMLRAYMHGYFCDARLYNKAKALVNPFEFEEYRKKKIREKLEEERTLRAVHTKKLPAVNRQLAQRLMEEETAETEETNKLKKKKSRGIAGEQQSLLKDDRFRALFENPEFEVAPGNEDPEALNPVLTQMARVKGKARKAKAEEERQRQLEQERLEFESKFATEDMDSAASSDIEILDEEEDESGESGEDNESEEDEEQDKAGQSTSIRPVNEKPKQTKVVSIREADEFRGWKWEGDKKRIQQERTMSLADRLLEEDMDGVDMVNLAGNAKEMTFTPRKKREEKKAEKLAEHVRERRRVRRSAGGIAGNRGGRRGRRK